MSPFDAWLSDLAPSAFVVADFLVRTFLWLGAVFLVLAALARRSAALRHLVGLVGLLALPLLPLGMAWSPAWLGFLPSFTRGAATPDPWAAWPTTAASPAWLAPLLAAWALVAIVLAGRTLAAGRDLEGFHVRARTSARAQSALDRASRTLGIERRPVVSLSDEIDIPVTFGVFDPKILLPADVHQWSAERMHVVLVHELAHLGRRDLLAQTASLAVTCLFWWQPLAWRLAHRLDLERERAADDLVLRATGNATHYARELVAIADALRGRPLTAFGLAMARPSQLGTRLDALLDDGIDRQAPGALRGLIVAGAMIVLLGPLAALPEPAEISSRRPATTVEPSLDTPRFGHGHRAGHGSGHRSGHHPRRGHASGIHD